MGVFYLGLVGTLMLIDRYDRLLGCYIVVIMDFNLKDRCIVGFLVYSRATLRFQSLQLVCLRVTYNNITPDIRLELAEE